MKHASPLDSPKNIFNQSQAVKGPQILKPNTNVIKNLGVNFEDLMPSHSDPTSPNFQKMSDLLKGPAFQGSKPISMVLPEYSQNSWIIPLQDQGLEISMPFEDLIGQLESPKLSDKMQMIFNSNVNLSESIMKNTFRAVDESRVKLEDKDLQVELEISELKLHHLEKRVEGCLASSKNTLARNVQLSQNVSKMVSPVKSSQGVLTTNIKTRSNSRINTPRLNPEDALSPITSQLIESKSEALSIGKNRTKSLTQSIPEAPENNVGIKNLTEMEREKALSAEKRVKSVSLSVQEPNSRLKDSIINEAYQKLTSYFGSGDSKTPEVNNQEEKYEEELATEAVKMRSSHAHSKSTELIMSNNVTFYTNLAEKEVCIDGEEQAKNFARLQSNEYLSEDQEPLQKQNYLFSSKPREAVRVSPSEPKANFMPQEVSLIDADGKERTFILKPKETLCVERLETIFIVPFGNKVPNLRKAKIRSQLSSFQGSETEECSQIKDNLKHNQNDQTIVGTQSRASLFDNSNVASMNLDKQEHKLSAFGGQAAQESMIQTNGVEDQKDNYLNNLKLQILNHPKCRKFFAADPSSASVRGRSVDISSKENDGLEFYFKQKIQDFREFLNEFEKILPTEPSLSPAKDSITRTNKIKQVKSWEALNKGQAVENINLESKTVENTPRGLSNENQEYMKEKYNSSMKKPMRVIEGLAEQSPLSCNIDTKNKPVRFENSEFRPQRLFKEKQDSPVSIGKVEFISVKPGFYSNVPLKKKVKAAKIGDQKETLQMAPKAIKLSKGNQSIALPSGQNKKTQVKSSSVKSFSQQVKTKKSKDLENSEVMETKKRREKNGIRENSKSIVEVISIGKLPTRANSVVVQK